MKKKGWVYVTQLHLHSSQQESHIQDSSDVHIKNIQDSINKEIRVAMAG